MYCSVVWRGWKGTNNIKGKLRETISPPGTCGGPRHRQNKHHRKDNKRAAEFGTRGWGMCGSCDSRSNSILLYAETMRRPPQKEIFWVKKKIKTIILCILYIMPPHRATAESREMKPQTLWPCRNVVKTKVENHQSAADAESIYKYTLRDTHRIQCYFGMIFIFLNLFYYFIFFFVRATYIFFMCHVRI